MESSSSSRFDYEDEHDDANESIYRMANQAPDWAKLRADFPILDQKVHGKPLIYFDNAATSQKPRAVIDALVHYYEHDNPNVHRGIHELSNRSTNAFEAARARAAKFINAKSSDEIVFTRGTTEGINLVASSWGTKNLKPGDVILLTELEHHSNLVPWQMIAQRTGAKVFAPFDIELGQIEKFDVTDVIYISVEGGAGQLRKLHQSLNRGALAFPESFAYHPHVTLAQEIDAGQVEALVALASRRWRDFRGPRRFRAESTVVVRNTRGNQWVDLAKGPLRAAPVGPLA